MTTYRLNCLNKLVVIMANKEKCKNMANNNENKPNKANNCGNCEKCKYQEKCIYRDNLTK